MKKSGGCRKKTLGVHERANFVGQKFYSIPWFHCQITTKENSKISQHDFVLNVWNCVCPGFKS